jgi:NADH:ubiquinone oxidoreductase subunit F (NADH-binding)
MAICGVTVGASLGYIYLRSEYPYVRVILERAIADAYKNGYLGRGIMGPAFCFDLELRTGQGSYICGEETALLESIEGERPESHFKPPFPGTEGLWDMPTVINNVETFCNVPAIIRMGMEEYRKNGTVKSPGTKLITLSGNIRNPGVYEFPMGISVRTLFEEVGGGCPNGKKLLGIQVGGGSGAIVGTGFLDATFDIESCAAEGVGFGTGSLLFFDEDTCVVGLCRNIMEFFTEESCGKCTPCRLGCERMLHLLTEIEEGRGRAEDLEKLKKLGNYMKISSLCGMGQAAPTAVLTALENFGGVFET